MAGNEKVVVKNIMEELVDMKITPLVQETGMCQCEICVNDVRALALNNLPPKYVVSTSGGIFVIVNAMTNQSQADIIAAIANAIRIVMSKPRHPQPSQ